MLNWIANLFKPKFNFMAMLDKHLHTTEYKIEMNLEYVIIPGLNYEWN